MKDLLILSGWTVYFIVHSFLAANKTKEFIKIKSPLLHKQYRIIYNSIALLGLILLSKFTFQFKGSLLFENSSVKFLGYGVILISMIILTLAFSSFDLHEFSGIGKHKEDRSSNRLIKNGLYRYVRHPLYFGTIIMFLGLFLAQPTLLILELCVLVIIYLIIGSKLEENKLIDQFGSEYLEYRKEVKGLVPFLF
jgi:methanethiol S-methyltransferase